MNWLLQLIDKLFIWLPRIQLIDPDEAGVRITCGKRFRAKEPGWYIYWPLIQSIRVLTVVIQVVDLREQGLMTQDGKNIAISGAVEYTIRDITKALLCVQDLDKNLPTLCLGKIAEYVELHDLKDCTSENLKTELRKGIREHVNDWGVAVKHIFITDRIIATAHKVMLNTTTAPFTVRAE